MTFDRSKFKKQSIEAIEKVTKEAEATMPTKKGGWTNYVTPQEGENIYRVCPALSGPAYVALKTSKLSCEVPTYDKDGNITGKEIKDKNVFCADVHGADILKGKDPINCYINYVYKLAEDIQDGDERKKFLQPITGFNSKKNGWTWGISPILAYVCYIQDPEDSNEVAKLQLRPTWLKDMKNESVKLSEDDALSIDVFSQVDEGYPLRIDKYQEEDKNKVKKWKFDVSAVTLKRGESWDDFFERNALSDELLEKLSSLPTLEESYVNVYSRKDWDLALDGLKRFDEKNDFGIFGNDEFLDELEQMEALLPNEEEEEEKPKSKTKKSTSKKEEAPKKSIKKSEAAEKAEKVASYPPMIKLKSFLKEFIETEYEGTEELPKDLTLQELREWYDLAKAGMALPFEEKEEEEEEKEEPEETEVEEVVSEEEEVEEEESPVEEATTSEADSKLQSAKARIANLRKK